MSAAKSVVTRVAIHPACADIGKRAHLGMGTGFHLRPVPSEVASASSLSGVRSSSSPSARAIFSSSSLVLPGFSSTEEAMSSSPSAEALSTTSAEALASPFSASGRGSEQAAGEAWSGPKVGSSGISESERVLSSTRSVYRGPCSTGVAHPKVRRLTRE